MVICKDCGGSGKISLPSGEEIESSTCEGEGEYNPSENHCKACGKPILENQEYCDFHRMADYVKS